MSKSRVPETSRKALSTTASAAMIPQNHPLDSLMTQLSYGGAATLADLAGRELDEVGPVVNPASQLIAAELRTKNRKPDDRLLCLC
jgi:hypothetical protein